MFSRILSSTTVVLAAAQLASAQTYTSCNPMEKKCPDDPALGSTTTVDFTKGANDLFTLAEGTTLTYDDNNGAVFTINSEGNAPTITSTKYIFFGKIDVTVRASTGTGIVTSFVLQSDDLDEVDWEWLGGDTTQVQTNYFGKGDTTTYDRGAYHSVATPQDTFHTYTVDWTKDYVKWYIDGNLVRTLNYADAKSGTRFPQTPMQIKLGTWVAGGKDSAPGTVEWAGGYTDFSAAPFNAYYKSITIQDYSNGVSGAKAYSWGDGNSDGSYGSIQVLTDDSSLSTSSSASATGSATTLSTATVTSHGGLTQATDGTDTNSTITSSGTQTIATPTVSGNSGSGSGSTATNTGASTTKSAAASTSAPASSDSFKTGASMLLVAGSAILAYLL